VLEEQPFALISLQHRPESLESTFAIFPEYILDLGVHGDEREHLHGSVRRRMVGSELEHLD
jgi:hypothetical protein|tara:strand:+ start:524 stop:706 length:183 start_codon:yes stop_codon:yes gene_type:complete